MVVVVLVVCLGGDFFVRFGDVFLERFAIGSVVSIL